MKTHSRAGLAPGASTERCRWNPEAVGTRARQHGGQRRLVDLHHDVGLGHPAPHVGDVDAQPLGEGLGELAARAAVGEHPVAARSLDGRRQRPRPGDLDLERAGVALAVLLDRVEVLRQQRPGTAVVDAPARR